MKMFGYEIRKVLPKEQEIRKQTYDGAMENALRGMCLAELELRHHQFLLDQAPTVGRTEAEVKGYTEAIERDKKSINNWATQIRAIKHEASE